MDMYVLILIERFLERLHECGDKKVVKLAHLRTVNEGLAASSGI